MYLEIKKDKRSSGKYVQKTTGLNSSVTKQIASIDISKEYFMNYISIEYIVLKACSCRMVVLNINTNFL
jgi:uncharacterized protein YpuA (DUF1002 family)